jgi:hypothetical protein
MVLTIAPGGIVRCLYGEDIDLTVLGTLTIARASHVEPDAQGRWWADMKPVVGPVLGPFPHRSDALRAESLWLLRHPDAWTLQKPVD